MSPRSERLASVDEANVVLDHVGQVNVFLVAVLLSAGGFVDVSGDADLTVLRAALRARIDALPELKRVLVERGRRHAWIDAMPDLEHHVRMVGAVEGLDGLEDLCGALMTTPLDRARPLWEILLVPGVDPHRAALVLRIHHAIADGMSAVGVVQRLLDPIATATSPAASAPARPAASPVGRSLGERVGYGARRIHATLAGRGVGTTVLLGPRSAHRGVVFLDVDLAALEARVRPRGATVNDALLAAVASGYCALLTAAAEPIPALLPVSVPVALARRGVAGNQVGVMLVPLPTGVADPDERLSLIATRTRAEKERARDQGTLEFMRGPVGARIMDLVVRRQHLVAGFVTNVRGPAERQHLSGAPIERMWPVAVIAANVRLGVAALSSAGRLACGVHFDADAVAGEAFASALRAELARLSS